MSPILAYKLLKTGCMTATSFFLQSIQKMTGIQNHVLNDGQT